MSFIPLPAEFGVRPDPELDREALLVRIASQALRLNDRLLAERDTRGKKRRRKQ